MEQTVLHGAPGATAAADGLPAPVNIAEASLQAANLPASREVMLPNGTTALVKRLSWLQFESLWSELAGVLAALAAADEDGAANELAQQLSGAPACALRLASLAGGYAEAELARWDFASVLALAGAALELNFTESAGVRSFFGALARLAQAGA
jgi:hypothetical protein